MNIQQTWGMKYLVNLEEINLKFNIHSILQLKLQ